MIFIFWIMCCAFINNSYGFNLTDITNAIEKIVDKANKTATFFAEEFKTDVDNIESVYDKATSIVAKVIHKAMKVGKKVYKSTTSLFRKADKGAFDVVKGFVNGVSEVVGTPINLEQLTFYLVTANNLENPKKIDFHEPEAIAKTKGKIFFLIHGWKASMNSSWYHDISESLTRQNSDTYVVQVNWDEPANDNYAFSAFDTESAGNFIGVLINKLVTEYQVPAKNFVLIGHSLGAQICGRAAKTFKKILGTKLPRIIALDPAGPLFLLRPNSKRLNRHDADVVMVIHTDADKLGFPTTTGTIDFYPNGGDNQPGCWDVDLGNVSTYTEPDIFGDLTSVFTGLSSNVGFSAGTQIGEPVSTFQEVVGRPARLEELRFYLFTLQNFAEPIVVNALNPLSVGGLFGRIFFLVHDRRESTKAPWMMELTEKLLQKYPDGKVVQVDWEDPANQEYAFAVYSTESVGKHISDVLSRLVVDLQVPLRNIVLIGFSLGAHICGFAGKYFTEKTHLKLYKIIALDPAGVLYALRPANKKLNRNDAETVHVIHTDGGKIGLTQPYGTIDFYPNGGFNQPGCPLTDGFNIENTVNCDHIRAYQYFIESLQNRGSFAAKQCLTAQELKEHYCSGSEVAMGDLDTTQTGIFFLETNAHRPFSARSTDDSLISSVFNTQDFAFPSAEPR